MQEHGKKPGRDRAQAVPGAGFTGPALLLCFPVIFILSCVLALTAAPLPLIVALFITGSALGSIISLVLGFRFILKKSKNIISIEMFLLTVIAWSAAGILLFFIVLDLDFSARL